MPDQKFSRALRWVILFLLLAFAIGWNTSNVPLAHAVTQNKAVTTLVAYWTFDEGAGTSLSDSSGNGHTGTINGATWVPGKLGQALRFDGASNYVQVPNAADLSGWDQFTFEAWVYRPGLGSTWQMVMEKPGNDGCQTGESYYFLWRQHPGLVARDGDWINNTIVNNLDQGFTLNIVPEPSSLDNAWHHFALTYDGNTLSNYIDGALDSSMPASGSVRTTTSPLYIGAGLGWCYMADFFYGDLDELKIYANARTADEIAQDAIDADGDGIADATDNCPVTANPDQADMDGDNIGDVCDPDRDGDGIANAVDNCPDTVNADQADADADGIGDVCDPDRDGDGVDNATDNCPDAANADQADADGDGIGDMCDPTPNTVGCSVSELIHAINAANANPDPTTIELAAACTYTLTSVDNDASATGGANGLPVITTEMTINANQSIIERDAKAPSFRIMTMTPDANLTINQLTIRNGTVAGGQANGGGINNLGGTLHLNASTVDNNHATWSGGGIHADGSNVLDQVTFINNSAAIGGGYFSGGGPPSGGSTAWFTNVTFTQNSASMGAATFSDWYATLNLENVTLANNSGTAIEMQQTAIVNVNNVTVANNTGRGIYMWSTASVNLSNTILANNATVSLSNTILANNASGNCVASILNGGNNLDSDGSCGVGAATDPKLDAAGLQNNGGLTQTIALASNSHAIDGGNDALCPVNDQRGSARADLHCDIGAFEYLHADGHTITKEGMTAGNTDTFGPTLAKILLASGDANTFALNRELNAPGNNPPKNALSITWDATNTSSPFSIVVTLCYDISYLNGQDEKLLHVFHYNGTTWDDLGGTLDTVTHAPYHCVTAETALTTLSPLILAPAPSTATNVTGLAANLNKQGNVVVTWKTTTESQIAGFNVYRKQAKTWKQINAQFIQAKHAGAVQGAAYRFQDKQVKKGNTYRYKIQVTYLDGHSEFTKIVKSR